MKSIFLFVLAFTAFPFWFCGCAFQHNMPLLENRITAMEQRCLKYEKKCAQTESGIDHCNIAVENFRSQYAELHVAIYQLREEMQNLCGRVEELEYLLTKATNRFEDSDMGSDKSLDIIKKRIVRIERYLNFEISDFDLKTGPVGQTEKEFSENELYVLAKQAFDKGDFEVARKGFKKLIKKYPKSGHADNAQFWIGEIYYREKWYEKAILEYQKVIEKYPKGNKMQASLLKQGLAFYNLGDKANARLILKELIKKYPQSNEAKIANQKLKRF